MEAHEYTFVTKQNEIDTLRVIKENEDLLVIVLKAEKSPPKYWVFSTQGDVLQDLGREDSIFTSLEWATGFYMTDGLLRYRTATRPTAPGSVCLLASTSEEETAHEIAREYVQRVRRAKNEKFRFRVTAYGE